MKRAGWWPVWLIIFFWAGTTYAQVVVHAGGGASLARSPEVMAGASPGLDLGAGLGAFIGPFVTVRTGVDYARFHADAAAVREAVGLTSGAVQGGGGYALALLVDLKLNAPLWGALSPYGVVGLGGLHFVQRDATVVPAAGEQVVLSGQSETGPAVSLAAGLNMVVSSRIALFVEARHIAGRQAADALVYRPLRVGVAVR
ncbi:MAG: hypothetical protein D6685_12955 [Bacteroidetes bacterium]|nr:hypothetical protein AWN76_004190 [Rhodothermaceae bacterium RA]RMH56921.1 MAG: hypothetical protein D6685_12955 [Bacteroidota bacterium]